MQRLSNRLSLSSTMLLVVGVALFAIAVPLISQELTAEHQKIEVMAERRAEAVLDMLEAVHIQSMIYRGQTSDGDPAIDTLNYSKEQFSKVNQNVDLQLVMGPKILAYQEANNQEELECPLPVESLYLICGARGNKVSGTAISNGVFRQCAKLGFDPTPPLHGLRKNAGMNPARTWLHSRDGDRDHRTVEGDDPLPRQGFRPSAISAGCGSQD